MKNKVQSVIKKTIPIRHFKITFKLTFRGNSRFEYLIFSGKENFGIKAADLATKYVVSERRRGGYFYAQYRPPKKVRVTEIESPHRIAKVKEKGLAFELQYSFFEATFANGRKEKEEWYFVKDNEK